MRSGPVPMDLFGNRGDCIEAWVEGMEPMNRLEVQPVFKALGIVERYLENEARCS